MIFDPDIHHRQSIRLPGYDYSGAGAYFVTICVQGRECLFGEVLDGEMLPNDAGRMVAEWWMKLPDKFPNVTFDEYVVMPNHFHGIVMINENCIDNGLVGAIHELPLRLQRRNMLIPKIIGYFKMNTAKQVNIMRDNPGVPVWQRNYYERIIRDDTELAAIREYIRHNPHHWPEDEENPNHP